MTKLNWASFESKFGDWAPKIKSFFESGKMDDIYNFLKKESKEGKQIAPKSFNTYRCFTETSYQNLNCVIFLQDPYFKFINDEPIASGVAMDCSISARVQPTLRNFYSGIETELFNGLNLDYINGPNLDYLTKQGVLLINTALTVEKDKAGSHADVWKEFTSFLLTEVLSVTGVPILFLGKEAQSFMPLVKNTNPCFKLTHPAAAAYSGGVWKTGTTFNDINLSLEGSNNELIVWLDFELPF
jgi:uracil-DNA glycosylase